MAHPKRFPIGLDKVNPGRVVAADQGRASPASAAFAAPVNASSAAFQQATQGRAMASVRARMVARLQAEGVTQQRVLDAMAQMPRDAFVDSALGAQAYEDTSLPIGHGQTISKPSIVARMLALLMDSATAKKAGHLGRALEIGTGCGYQAALLSILAPTVISIERLRALHEFARSNLSVVPQVRRTALRLVLADGRLGHPPNAPYDAIIAAAVGNDLPQAWIDQLAVGGRLVAPQTRGNQQVLVVVDRTSTGVVQQVHEAVRFVPLESGVVR